MGKRVIGQNYDTFMDPKEIAEFIVYIISFDKEMVSEEIKLNRINWSYYEIWIKNWIHASSGKN